MKENSVSVIYNKKVINISKAAYDIDAGKSKAERKYVLNIPCDTYHVGIIKDKVWNKELFISAY